MPRRRTSTEEEINNIVDDAVGSPTIEASSHHHQQNHQQASPNSNPILNHPIYNVNEFRDYVDINSDVAAEVLRQGLISESIRKAEAGLIGGIQTFESEGLKKEFSSSPLFQAPSKSIGLLTGT